MSVLTIDNNNFEAQVLGSTQPVLVDFWAPWCSPCRMMGPIIDQVAEEKKGQIKVGKLNIDDFPQLASKYGVMSIPTLILFKDGKVAAQKVGLQNKAAVEAML